MGAKSHNFCLFSVYFQHYFKKIVQNPIILPVFSLFCCFFRRFVDGISNVYIDSRYIDKFEKYRYRYLQGLYKKNRYQQGGFGKFRYRQGDFGKYRYRY